MTLEFDAVVVGSGPAGSSAGLVMARAGLRVAILERGETAGSKNVTGGILNSYELSRLLPDLWREAPLERRIVRYSTTFLGEAGAVSVDYRRDKAGGELAPAFSVVRPRFDRWLCQQAVEAGALMVPETLVEDLLWEDQRVVGVRAGRAEGEMRAEIVIAADGVNSTLAHKGGLRSDWRPSQVGLALKESHRQPSGVIEERFGLGTGDGAAMLFAGGLPGGLRGGGFLYTNGESISLGVVLQLDSVAASTVSCIDALEAFKAHPAVRHLVRGGTMLECSAHLVPEGGYRGIARLYTGGLMAVGDAAGFVLNTGLTVEGMNYAIASGVAAGETAVETIRAGDVGPAALASYPARLEAKGVLADFRRFRHTPRLLANPRMHDTYPKAVVAAAGRWYTVGAGPRQNLAMVARAALRGKAGLGKLISDGILAWRALL